MKYISYTDREVTFYYFLLKF